MAEQLGFLEHWLRFLVGEHGLIINLLARTVRSGGDTLWAATFLYVFIRGWASLGLVERTAGILVGVLLCAVSYIYVPAWRRYRNELLDVITAGRIAIDTFSRREYAGREYSAYEKRPQELIQTEDALRKLDEMLRRAIPDPNR